MVRPEESPGILFDLRVSFENDPLWCRDAGCSGPLPGNTAGGL